MNGDLHKSRGKPPKHNSSFNGENLRAVIRTKNIKKEVMDGKK